VLALIVTVLQRVVLPCVNVTFPVGRTFVDELEGGVTVAVRVTCWFTAGEVGEDVNMV